MCSKNKFERLDILIDAWECLGLSQKEIYSDLRHKLLARTWIKIGRQCLQIRRLIKGELI